MQTRRETVAMPCSTVPQIDRNTPYEPTFDSFGDIIDCPLFGRASSLKGARGILDAPEQQLRKYENEGGIHCGMEAWCSLAGRWNVPMEDVRICVCVFLKGKPHTYMDGHMVLSETWR